MEKKAGGAARAPVAQIKLNAVSVDADGAVEPPPIPGFMKSRSIWLFGAQAEV